MDLPGRRKRGLYDSDMNLIRNHPEPAKSEVGLTEPLTVSGRAPLVFTGLRMRQLTIEWE